MCSFRWWCALATAVYLANEEMVNFLVMEMKANVNINHQNLSFTIGSPLTIAIWGCNETMIKLLIEDLGADINLHLETKAGLVFLPLHVAMYVEANQ